jgi:sulfatase maturation enzyme AslB (radical SAM superfamily)
MNGRVFSVILLPTSECNVACDYCFEHKEPHRLSPALLPLLTRRLLDHLEHENIEVCEIYWQGGEAMIMGPEWVADAGHLMGCAAPYCEVYKVVFARAEAHGQEILRRRSASIGKSFASGLDDRRACVSPTG